MLSYRDKLLARIERLELILEDQCYCTEDYQPCDPCRILAEHWTPDCPSCGSKTKAVTSWTPNGDWLCETCFQRMEEP